MHGVTLAYTMISLVPQDYRFQKLYFNDQPYSTLLFNKVFARGRHPLETICDVICLILKNMRTLKDLHNVT